MKSPAVLEFDASDAVPEVSFVAGDKRPAGNPQQTLWLHYTDPTRITNADGRATTVIAGESFVIPRGFNGTWEVVETTTKRFVIYEAGQ